MANEDYNIYHWVMDHSSSGMKKAVYWDAGYKLDLWRSYKSIGSLRSRYRFYVKYLVHDDLLKLERYVTGDPVTIRIGYVNFKSTTENYTCGPKMFYSVL